MNTQNKQPTPKKSLVKKREDNLRANLLKRKQQMRERKNTDVSDVKENNSQS